MIPRLSCNQRTTAPAMATEPWQEVKQTQTHIWPVRRRIHLLWVAQALNHKMRILSLDADPVPPVHKKQVCLDPVCTPQWSEGRDPTSPAAQQKQKKCLKRQHGCNAVLQVQIFRTVPWVQCFAGENSQSHTWNTPMKRQFALRDKSQKVQEVTHVFLAWPSWKHIWPTRAADWSPRHCYRRK